MVSDRATTTGQALLLLALVAFVPAVVVLGEPGVWLVLLLVLVGVPLRLYEDGRVIH